VRIGLLHYAAPPVVGGVESVIGHHARLMNADGHSVTIIAGRGAQVDDQINFFHLPLADSRHPDILAVKAGLDAGQVPADFEDLTAQLMTSLEAVCRSLDVVIAHNVCSLAKNLPLTAALHRLSTQTDAPRWLLWHHDLAWTTPRYQRELHAGYPWDLLRTDWPHAIQVVVSRRRQAELAALLKVPHERIHVVPNGVDICQFHKMDPLTETFINRLNLLQANPLLLLPVRITPRKNIELALHVLAAVRQFYPAAQLVVTGPLGPHNPANVQYFARLTKLRQDLQLERAAHFLTELVSDFLPDSVISDFYHLADALLLPSKEEGFGIPVLEAALAGLPIFCADIPPLRELGGKSATYFSPTADPRTVAQDIVARLSIETTFASRVQVRQQFTWERIYAAKIAPLLA